MSNSTTTPNHVMVIDPLNFGGLLKIPLSKTFDSKGRNDWLKGVLKKDLSICCLFQRGKCHAGSKCHQVHADRNFVAELRAQCAHITSCCLRCGDTASSYPAGRTMFAELRAAGCSSINLNGSCYPLECIAYTVGLASYLSSAPRPQVFMSGDTFNIPSQRVCRLHLRSGCKYGKDCKNIHVCSQLGECAASEAQYQPQQTTSRRSSFHSEASQPQYHHSPPSPMPSNQYYEPRMALPSPPASYLNSAYPTPGPSNANSPVPIAAPTFVEIDSSFNQESMNHPHTQLNASYNLRHSFGEELQDEESIGPENELAFELKIVSEKKSNFLFRWSHPANASPVPTCVASQSLKQLVATPHS